MEDLLAILIGFLYAVGIYHILRHSIVKLILGLIFITHATNLLLFFSGGLGKNAPIIKAGAEVMTGVMPEAMVDPLPQAFILTAIVISFGIIAFFIVLIFKTHEVSKTKDLDEIYEEEI